MPCRGPLQNQNLLHFTVHSRPVVPFAFFIHLNTGPQTPRACHRQAFDVSTVFLVTVMRYRPKCQVFKHHRGLHEEFPKVNMVDSPSIDRNKCDEDNEL